MNHEEYKELLALEALGALDVGAQETLLAHLATCAGCQAELSELRDTAAMLVYTVAPVAPPAGLRARVLEGIRNQGNGLASEPLRATVPRTDFNEPVEAPSNVVTLAAKKSAHEGLTTRRSTFVFGAIAAGLVIATLVAALALLWKRDSETRTQLARASDSLQASQATEARLAESLKQTQAELSRERDATAADATPTSGATPQTDAGADTARVASRNNELRTELARIAGRNETLQANINRLSNRTDELQAELARSSTLDHERQAEIARLTNLNRETQAQLAALANRNRELQIEITRLASRDTELQTQVARFTNQTNELQSEVARLTRRSGDLQNELARRREADSLITAPGSRAVALAGTKAAPGATAKLIYDRQSGNVALFAYDLPPAPPGKTYQLWLIAGGKPQSAGVFTTDREGRAVLRSQVPRGGRNASVFAVTLEPAGGVSAPTGDKYLLSPAS
ncbi:MAG: anti-sigma factor [Pyrinomonadaceae bacterium]|nr:anti-sigma factor [Pyrinomonadaceae bacterium]